MLKWVADEVYHIWHIKVTFLIKNETIYTEKCLKHLFLCVLV